MTDNSDKPTIQRDAHRGGKSIRLPGKGKALNALAAAAGRDPSSTLAHVASFTEKEARKEAQKQREDAEGKRKGSENANGALGKNKPTDSGKVGETGTNKPSKTKKSVMPSDVELKSHLYNSLSESDQYRFECYRRCGFESRAISKFVSRILVEESHRRCCLRSGVVLSMGGKFGNSGSSDDEAYSRWGNGGIGAVNPNNNDPSNGASTVTDTSGSDGEDSNRTKSKNQSRKFSRMKKRSKKQFLKEESKRRRAAMDRPPPYSSFCGSGCGVNGYGNGSVGSARGVNCSTYNDSARTPPLENLVVPNSASEIVAVVSTLAKCYAQRLVAAARRVADAEESRDFSPDDILPEQDQRHRQNGEIDQKQSPQHGKHHQEAEPILDELATSPPTKAKRKNSKEPLLPRHFLEAHRYRAQAGIDPGFWLSQLPSTGGSVGGRGILRHRSMGGVSCGTSAPIANAAAAAAVGTKDWSHTGYLAALAAQDNYDRMKEEEEENHAEEAEEKDDSVVNHGAANVNEEKNDQNINTENKENTAENCDEDQRISCNENTQEKDKGKTDVDIDEKNNFDDNAERNNEDNQNVGDVEGPRKSENNEDECAGNIEATDAEVDVGELEELDDLADDDELFVGSPMALS